MTMGTMLALLPTMSKFQLQPVQQRAVSMIEENFQSPQMALCPKLSFKPVILGAIKVET